MSRSEWRPYANAIITKIILENNSVPEKDLRKKISEAYPWGERANHPYKIWCSAVQECLWTLRRIGKRPTAAQEQEVTLFNQKP